jgi:peptide/nickel transport system ATP-binding protein
MLKAVSKNTTKENAEAILSVRGLKVYFYTYAGVVKAIDGIDFDLYKGETLGLVGETGCGKSVTASSILRLIDSPGRIVEGKVLFKGEDLLEKTEKEMRKVRGAKIAMVFQDPATYINPVYTIGNQIAEVIKVHQRPDSKDLKQMTVEALKLVRMPDPERVVDRYPYELSTGMRQRAMIAMMLSCRPELLIADEATTALDVTVQAQILRLLRDLKERLNLSVIFITHSFGVVAKICDRVAVMYAGQIVELGSKYDIFDFPMHPYTRALLGAIPQLGADASVALESIPGTLPNLIYPPSGCRFHDRCTRKSEKCGSGKPELVEVEAGHYVACFHLN